MKGQLNSDGFVMDFGDVKNVSYMEWSLSVVYACRVQETESEVSSPNEEWCTYCPSKTTPSHLDQRKWKQLGHYNWGRLFLLVIVAMESNQQISQEGLLLSSSCPLFCWRVGKVYRCSIGLSSPIGGRADQFDFSSCPPGVFLLEDLLLEKRYLRNYLGSKWDWRPRS